MKIPKAEEEWSGVFYPKAPRRPPGTLQWRPTHGARDAISLVENGLRRRAVGAVARAGAAAVRLCEGETLGRRGGSFDRRRRSGVARGAANGKIPRHLHRGEKREG